MTDYLKNLIASEAFWTLLSTVVVGYLANTVVSRGLVAKLPPTSPIRRAIRLLHGFLDKVDPKVLALAFALPLTTGCAWWTAHKSEVIDAAEATCVAALALRPEVVEEAKRRNLTGNEWAGAICELPDILEPFLLEQSRAVAAPQACAVAREKGLVR